MSQLIIEPQFEVSYLMEQNDSTVLSRILDSLPNKELVNTIRSHSSLNYIPEPFTINRKNDTIIVKVTPGSIRFFSSSDNTILCRKNDCVEDKRYYTSRPSPFDYYENLLLAWDIDSLEILCLYDQIEYEVTPNDSVFRFIVRNGDIIGIDTHVFHSTPAEPDKYVDYSEKMRRIEIQRRLQSQDSKTYKRLFIDRRNNSFFENAKQWLIKVYHQLEVSGSGH